jgi:AraC-like DNA-binding protein
MQKVVFASDEFPRDLDDAARFSRWRDLYAQYFFNLDFSRPHDRPFSARFEFTRLGDIGLGSFKGTVNRSARTPREVAADGNDRLCLFLNRGRSDMSSVLHNGEAVLPPGAATLLDYAQPAELRGDAENAWLAVVTPRARVLELVPNAEDMISLTLVSDRPAVRLLGRYLAILLATPEIANDPSLLAHADRTLTDLVALALEAGRDAAEIAGARGLRAARLQDILTEIGRRFADPTFVPDEVARRLGVTTRYVQKLLHDTGVSFTERVLELRLQKARAMLAHPRHDRLKVSAIAAACGFKELSYFDRCFRRGFGASPTQYRGSGRGGP